MVAAWELVDGIPPEADALVGADGVSVAAGDRARTV